MKKINILLLTSLIAFSGCDSILDKAPLDSFTDDNFWTNESNVSGYANAFYEEFTGYGNGGGAGLFYYKTLSDDQAGNSFADWPNLNVPATDSNWKSCWEEIRRACIMMEKIPAITSMDEATQNHWIGVARMMRAWEYYHLVRMFGDVPWIDKSLNINDGDVLYSKRENRDIVMDKVLEDINFACTNMIAGKGSKITFSVDMANAIKAEICLYEGTFRKYRKVEDKQAAPDLEGAKRYLAEAKASCKVIMGKEYELNASYQGNYNSTDLSSNPEMILYKAYKQSLLTHSLVDYTCSSTQISGMTKDAFEAYLFREDGKPLSLTSANTSDLPTEVMEKKIIDKGKDTEKEVTVYRYSIKDILKLRDARLEQTIDTCVFYNGRGFTRFNVGMEMTSSTGYGVSKYDNAAIPVNFRNQTSSNYTHCPLFWLSVIYLQYAEASAELSELGGEAITQADLDISINLLRDRAKLPKLNKDVDYKDPKNTIGVSNLIWEIRRERRCELMFDNWTRYWDLIRWHQLDKLDSTKNPDILLGANLSADKEIAKNEKVTLVGNYMDGSKDKTRTFDVKYYLYPIPSGQIDLNPNLAPNNPGW